MHLVVHGTGAEEGALVNQARRRGVRLAVHGLKDHGEMAKAMAAAHVQVQPSRRTADWTEQFGRTVAEAMTVGLPCVVSSSGELPHVVGNDPNVVFEEGDRASLHAILQRLSDHPDELNAVSRRQHALALERYAPSLRLPRSSTSGSDAWRIRCETTGSREQGLPVAASERRLYRPRGGVRLLQRLRPTCGFAFGVLHHPGAHHHQGGQRHEGSAVSGLPASETPRRSQ